MILADTIARFQRKMMRPQVVNLFTGTDEYGSKVAKEAARSGMHPKAWTDKLAPHFQSLADNLNIGYHRFIRTTDEDHRQAVTHLWKQLVDRESIYRGQHAGWYCSSEECFYPERETIQNVSTGSRVSLSTGKEVTWVEETNYLFRLSKYRNEIRKWLQESAVIWPPGRTNDLWQYLEDDEFKDISISRRAESVSWGIPVPGDNQQTIYVWLDALTNYLTVGGYPNEIRIPKVQVLGKDILKFHAIYWPAFLLAAGLDLPQRLLVHGHWIFNGQKMSKSLGNVISPLEIIENYGVDALRYYLLRTGKLSGDCEFDEKSLVNTVNNELVNQLGNLISRAFSPSIIELSQASPQFPENPLLSTCQKVKTAVNRAFEEYNFSWGLEQAATILHHANSYFTAAAPWRANIKPDEVTVILENIKLACLMYAELLQPVCPNLAEKINQRILNYKEGITTQLISRLQS